MRCPPTRISHKGRFPDACATAGRSTRLQQEATHRRRSTIGLWLAICGRPSVVGHLSASPFACRAVCICPHSGVSPRREAIAVGPRADVLKPILRPGPFQDADGHAIPRDPHLGGACRLRPSVGSSRISFSSCRTAQAHPAGERRSALAQKMPPVTLRWSLYGYPRPSTSGRRCSIRSYCSSVSS